VATVSFGQPVSLTWSSTDALTCLASGGASGDGWAGSKATSGGATVVEDVSGSYAYALTCANGAATARAVVEVTVNPIPPPSGGGSGSLDLGSLLVLLMWIALTASRRTHRNIAKTTLRS
jgi:hypothetical protein